MKRFLPLAIGCALAGCCLMLLGAGPDSQFVDVYELIQEADRLERSGQGAAALTGYEQAEKLLNTLRRGNPDWNPSLVSFRLEYVGRKIAEMRPRYRPLPPREAPTIAPETGVPAPNPAVSDRDGAEFAAVIESLRAQVAAAQDRMEALRVENQQLDARLREALSARPANAEAEALAEARNTIGSLRQEISVLRRDLEQARAVAAARPEPSPVPVPDPSPAPGPDPAVASELAETKRILAREQAALASLRAENDRLQSRLDEAKSAADRAGSEVSSELAETKRLLTAEQEALGRVRAEQDQLRARLAEATDTAAQAEARSAEEIRRLTATLQSVRRELEQARSQASTNPSEAANLATVQRELNGARDRAAELAVENAALEKQVETLRQRQRNADPEPNPTPRAPAPTLVAETSDADERIKRLESERDALQEKLNAANKELYDNQMRIQLVNVEQMTNQIAILRARLEAFEARKVPYTREELALMREPAVTPAPVQRQSSIRDLPTGAGPLVKLAQNAFERGRLEEAEGLYRQVLDQDDDNVYILANLALIEMEQGKLEAAETHVKKALEGAPQDAFSLSLLGILKFRQQEFDASLDALSRSARVDDSNPETQNYLGIVLSQKGMRGPAEAALRKAIKINPAYASAHYNLAIVYATQEPPFVELARFHYEKARQNGHPANPELERMFSDSDSVPASDPSSVSE